MEYFKCHLTFEGDGLGGTHPNTNKSLSDTTRTTVLSLCSRDILIIRICSGIEFQLVISELQS